MFDTYITVIGTALNTPERRLTKGNIVVASFRVASQARRYDKQNQQWVDGASMRIRVTCWRRLAEHVSGSIFAGDAVVVHGRIATHDWVNDNGEPRLAYELEAVSVGHDLSRGTAAFTRARPETAGVVVEDPQDELEPPFEDFGVVENATSDDALAILAEAGLHVPEPGEEDDEEEASAGPNRGRKRTRQPVPA